MKVLFLFSILVFFVMAQDIKMCRKRKYALFCYDKFNTEYVTCIKDMPKGCYRSLCPDTSECETAMDSRKFYLIYFFLFCTLFSTPVLHGLSPEPHTQRKKLAKIKNYIFFIYCIENYQ